MAIAVKEPGYIYLYLSNDNVSLGGAQVEVYFDDFKVEYQRSPMVQSEDYYPFGLTFSSYSRENSFTNQWKFQGQENVDELGLNWDSFKWRNHQPEIGRFFGVDPLAEKYLHNSPYAFSENKVVSHRELEGLEAEPVNIEQQVTNIKVSPIWRNGDLLGYNISFTLTEQTTEIQTDDNKMPVATVQTTSVSNHSIRIERSGFPTFRPGTMQRNWMRGYFAKSETAKVTTTVTPISLNREGPTKSTTSTKYEKTGIVFLTDNNTKKLQSEHTKKQASVGEQYIRFILSSNKADKRKNRMRDNGDGPRR